MSGGFRAAVRASVLIASIWMLAEPLPTGGALAFSPQTPADSLSADHVSDDTPYLDRLRATTPILPNDELRALWVVRDAITTPESINRLVDFAVQTRIQVLFVQVRGRGDAYYKSDIVPPSSHLQAPLSDFDPLAYLLTVAHREGITVHAWLNVFLIWSERSAPPPGHLLALHPEWLLTDARGVRMDSEPRGKWKRDGIEGVFMSPAVSDLRRHMARVVRELVTRYDVDGIHLDYIRYPNRRFAFDAASRTAFAIRWGVDPAQLAIGDRGKIQSVIGAAALAYADSLFSQARMADVDSMVVAVREACPGRALSAAVGADPLEASHDKAQDWPTWVHQHWVDFVVPMAYNAPPLELEYRAQVYTRLVGKGRFLVGLGVFGGRDEYLEESVALLRKVGVSGFALFSYNALAEKSFPAALIQQAVLPPDTTATDTDDDDQ